MLSLPSDLPSGGWSITRKDVKLHQVIGKGEFGGKHFFIYFFFFVPTTVNKLVFE